MGVVFSSREIVKRLLAEGWYEVRCVGDHHQFKHATKAGKVTVPHPKRELDKKVANSIFKQAGWK